MTWRLGKKYQFNTSNRFADLENLKDSEEINWASENIKKSIKTLTKDSLGLYKLKQHKPCFNV